MHNYVQIFENLLERSHEWIKENSWEEGAAIFLTNAGIQMPKKEKKNREMSFDIAVLWYDHHLKGDEDGKNIPADIGEYLQKKFPKKAKEHPEEYLVRIREMWDNMCQHVAEYNFAKIESTHPFHRALWGGMRTFMDEEKMLEIVDIPIRNALLKGYKESHPDLPSDTNRLLYGVKKKGLDSEIVFITQGSWVDHADMFIQEV